VKRLEEKVHSFLQEYLPKKKKNILVAFSGGPDSTALLHTLYALGEIDCIHLGVVYVNHNVRNENEVDAEEKWVRNSVETLEIPLFTKTFERNFLKKAAYNEKLGLEAAARKYRYDFFDMILKTENYQYIALGHTYDDRIETTVMRFFQGSDVEGLSGIPIISGTRIRPLSFMDKQSIKSYLKEKSVPFIKDSTNSTDDFLRNKVRNELLPKVNEIFPGYKTALLHVMEKMESNSNFLNNETERTDVWRPIKNGFAIEAQYFLALHSAVKIRHILRLYNNSEFIEKKRERLPYRFLKPLQTLNIESCETKTILRGYGFVLYIKDSTVFWQKDIVVLHKKGYVIKVEKDGIYQIYDKITMHVMFNNNAFSLEDRNCISIRILKNKLPLIIRSKREGDALRVNTGSKSLKKLFSEWKIPVMKRQEIPVLETQQGIQAVIGAPFGGKNRYSVSDKNNTDISNNSEAEQMVTVHIQFQIME